MDDLITRLKHEIEFLSTEGFVLTEKRTITLLEDCLEALTSQWVSVADRLPEHGQRVVILRKTTNTNLRTQIIHWWEGDETDQKVIYWMPLPLPPIEKEQEK